MHYNARPDEIPDNGATIRLNLGCWSGLKYSVRLFR